VLVVVPVLVALLTQTPDAVTRGLLWLLGVADCEAAFFLARWLLRRKA
jgi:hypothetical protein